MNVTALLTAKGGNTLSRKNLLPVNGKPLLTYPAMAAKSVETINHFYVSSEDEEILTEAGRCGYLPICRPPELAMPNSQHVDVIRHALKVMKEQDGLVPDILIVLLGNTVCIKKSWIEESIQMLLGNPELSAVVPVYLEQDHHPYRAKRLNEKGELVGYFDSPASSNRQDLPKNYFLNHNFWALRLVNALDCAKGIPPWNFMGDHVRPIVVNEGLDVHTKADLLCCETWLKYNDIFE